MNNRLSLIVYVFQFSRKRNTINENFHFFLLFSLLADSFMDFFFYKESKKVLKMNESDIVFIFIKFFSLSFFLFDSTLYSVLNEYFNSKGEKIIIIIV